MTSTSASYPTAVRHREWYRLDNAGKLYPAITTSKWNSVFRVSIILRSEINPQTLQEALDSVFPRFPILQTQLCTGLFWYYLEKNPKRLLIQEDEGGPCEYIPWQEKNMHLLRVSYLERRISIDFFHAITDGAGSMVFLKTLVAEYLRLSGTDVPYHSGVLDPSEEPNSGETEDALQRMPLPQKTRREYNGKAYRMPGDKRKSNERHMISYRMPVEEVKAKAKAIGVTITEYLVAVKLYIAYQEQLKNKKKKPLPVKVSVPVNMRSFFPTQSLRNCSWIVSPELAPPFEKTSLEEIALSVQEYMKQALVPEKLYASIAPNVANERGFLRFAPLPLKNLVIRSVYKAMGSKSKTTTLTNLGRFTAPPEMMEQIEGVETIIGPDRVACTSAAIITLAEQMYVTYTSNQEEPIMAHEFERLLLSQGISVQKEVLW